MLAGLGADRTRWTQCGPGVALALLLGACAAGELDWRGRDDGLADYHRAFEADVGAAFDRTATPAVLLAQIRQTRVLWLGDHHLDRELHRYHRQLLDQLLAAGLEPALGLEALGIDDQPAVDAFLDGRIDLQALAQEQLQRWRDGWLSAADVDARHYRELLATARSKRLPVFALEPAPRLPLQQRDAAIAATVREAADRHPGRLLVVVVGQAHLLGEGRLPARVGRPGVALGAEPTATLRQAAPRAAAAGGFVRSSGGLWFFADLLAR
jgi:hypothetical protein